MPDPEGNPPGGDLPDGPLGGLGYGESGGNGAGRVSLSEATQATEDVLTSCQQELRFLRRRLRGSREEPDLSELERGREEENFPSPAEQALRVASRLEACANALRNASAPVD